MIYYRVKPEFDNRAKVHRDYGKTRYHYKYDIFIANELYTPSEIELMRKKKIKLFNNMFDEIEIPKNKTYFFFGARFENKE